jgi:hypothetical protein
MAKPVTLSNGRSWKTKSAAHDHFQAMLNRHKNGDCISDPVDHDDLIALLKRYDDLLPPGEATKAGSGVAHFFRDRNGGDGYTSDCFWVHRTDGSRIDFSFVKAVKLERPFAPLGLAKFAVGRAGN